MKKNLLNLFFLFFTASFFAQTSSTYSTSGAGIWTCPAGVTTITVQVYGAGGGGGGGGFSNKQGGAGGGGGGYNIYNSVTVIQGTAYNITVGTGGAAGTGATSNGGSGVNGVAGGSTTATFGSTTVTATGGAGGKGWVSTSANVTGGAGGTGFGSIIGGTGGSPTSGTTVGSGSGGGCAGITGSTPTNGNNGTTSNVTGSFNGGAGGGGNAGSGGTGIGNGGNSGVGGAGNNYGGGGGGGSKGDGAAGAGGYCIITYSCPSFGTVSAGTNQTLTACTTTTTLNGSAVPSGMTGTWSVVSGTATITNPNSPTSGVTGLVLPTTNTGTTTTTLRWTISNRDCGSTFSDVVISTIRGSGCWVYCPVSATTIYAITSVSVNTINNAVTGTAGYEDFTSISTSLYKNVTYPITVNFNGASGNASYVNVFVDWNNDGDFLDTGEELQLGTTTVAPFSFTSNLTVPSGAVLGNTRMRVIHKILTAYATSCTNFTNGQVEDYTLTIIDQPACSGTPTPGDIVTTNGSPCGTGGATNSYTLSLSGTTIASGLTYLWESSSNGTSWATASGTATNSTYSATTTSTIYYRCKVSCGVNTATTSVMILNYVSTCYCTPVGSNAAAYGYLTNVNVNSGAINRTSTWDGYINTGLSATLQQGSTYTISLGLSNSSTTGRWTAAWIDWNNNGVLNDSGEDVMPAALSTASPTDTRTLSFTVPIGAALGTTKLRVVHTYQGGTYTAPTPCAALYASSSDWEDYIVNITSAPACSGAPTAGGLTNTNPVPCATGTTTSFTLGSDASQTTTGITYQWYKSTDGTTFSAISNATNTAYTSSNISISDAAYYYLTVSCSNSAQTASTNIMYVGYSNTCYCNSTSTSNGNEYIKNVSSGSVSNSTGLNKYSNYSSISLNTVQPNSTVTINVTNGIFFTADRIYIYVDWDNNGVLNDAGEVTGPITSAATNVATVITVTVPVGATAGIKRVRIKLGDITTTQGGATVMNNDPCQVTFTYGEVEDYSIIVCPIASISTQPVSTTVCLGSSASLNTVAFPVSGTSPLTYQWQVNSGSGFSNVVNSATYSGATTASLNITNASISLNNYTYKLNVTNNCGVLIASSTVTLTVINPPTVSTLTAGDYIWRGTTSDYTSASNWFAYNGTSFSISAVAPTTSNNVIIPSSATCVSLMPNISANSVNSKNLTIETGASLTMNTGTLNIAGNWTNNGTFTPSVATVNFNGTTSQSISKISGNELIANLIVNKASGSLTLNSPVEIGTNINFTSGLINSDATNLLIIKDNATATGASNTSHVVGPVRKIGDEAFTFPVGKGGNYAPAAIGSPSLTADHFTAEYFNTDPSGSYNVTSKDNTIDNISACEYWMINRTGGSSDVTVNLSWNSPRSCAVTSPNDLLVARWDGALWKDHGNGGINGTSTTGNVITAGFVTNFSPFALAYKTINPLPIELLNYDLSCENKEVVINWSTASEINNNFYTIERSLDGLTFESIAFINGHGTTVTKHNYSYTDTNPIDGLSYYQLKQTDFNGLSKTYNLKSINCETKNSDIIIYPNPNKGTFVIHGTLLGCEVTITNILGKVIYSVKGNEQKTPINLQELSGGVYYININKNDVKVTKKVVID